MQTNNFNCIKERIRNKITDSLLYNKKFYVIYFGFLILGAFIGFLSGKELPYEYDIMVDNKISAILYENASVFYVFRSDIFTFLLIYLTCFLGLCLKFFAFLNFFVSSLIAFRAVRNATCLFVLGGICNILGAILFYLVYYIGFLILLSYTVSKCFYFSKSCPCALNFYQKVRIITPSYLFTIAFCLIYSVSISLILTIFSI